MDKIKYLVLVFTILTVLLSPLVKQTAVAEMDISQVRPLDYRALVLESYLAKHNAPLRFYARDFVEAADTYNLDWKLVAAISGVESTFGKRVPGGTDPQYSSYNGWGWGVYGTQAIYFKSWRDGIFTVSEGLRKNYFDKGLTDPYSINKKYASSPTWGSKVTFFLEDITRFEAQFKEDLVTGKLELEEPMSGPSAQPKI